MDTATKTTWNVDKSHSEIGFKVKHMMISTVTGQFDDFDATLESDDENFTNANASFAAKVATVNTKNTQRDEHLRSDDFFNAERFPELKFQSKSFDGEKLIGDLTIRDVTKEVVLDVAQNGLMTDPYGNRRAGFEVSGEIKRKEFNLNWNAATEAGGVVVSDKVKLQIDLQFIKQA